MEILGKNWWKRNVEGHLYFFQRVSLCSRQERGAYTSSQDRKAMTGFTFLLETTLKEKRKKKRERVLRQQRFQVSSQGMNSGSSRQVPRAQQRNLRGRRHENAGVFREEYAG